MKNLAIAISTILILFSFNSCLDTDGCVRGNGTQEEYDLGLSNFQDINVEGAVNIVLTQGPVFETILEVEPNIYEILEIGVSGTTLFIGTKTKDCYTSPTAMTLYVTAPDFNEISIAGTSEITSTADLDLDNFSIVGSGVVASSVTGNCNNHTITISGSAVINHFGLVSDDVVIIVSGSGNFDVYAENTLDITVSGSATINYKGTPQITQDVSGSIILNNAN